MFNRPAADRAAAQIREAVAAAGGVDIRLKEHYFDLDPANLTFEVTFTTSAGLYYTTWCKANPHFDRLFWTYSPLELVAGLHVQLAFDMKAEEQRAAQARASHRLAEQIATKERLLDLLHSAYRHERLWGIRLSAELGKNDGVVVERIRDLAYIDQVKEVRQAAAERLAQIDGGTEE
jgi:hypothetical protein